VKNYPGLKVALVGATGMVGREFLPLLEKTKLPIGSFYPFSSGTRRQTILFRGKKLPAPGVDFKTLASCELVFFASADEVSKKFAPRLARAGVWVIDDSSAFRLDRNVPIVIPEVNGDRIRPSHRILAGPNCTITGLAVAGALLHRKIGVKEVRLASYQAVSGAGKDALLEFFSQLGAVSASLKKDFSIAPALPKLASRALPRQIALNVIPQVGGFDREGNCGEENKVASELRKIWAAPGLKISSTTVRVPVVRGHSLAVWLTLSKAKPLSAIRAILNRTPGVSVKGGMDYPTPLDCAGKGGVSVGRLRLGATSKEICLWIVSDNLLKGAALNSLQTAEYLWRRGWLKARP
jgi:aspartate-semialdehyde dehydrogenase